MRQKLYIHYRLYLRKISIRLRIFEKRSSYKLPISNQRSGKRTWKEFASDSRHFHGPFNGERIRLGRMSGNRNLTSYLAIIILTFFSQKSLKREAIT